MSIHKMLTFLVILLPLANTHCQDRMLVGLEIGPKFELYQYWDEGDALRTSLNMDAPWGFTIAYELTDIYYIEAVLLRNSFNEAYYFQTPNGNEFKRYSSTHVYSSWQPGLRSKIRLSLYRGIFLTHRIGGSILLNSYTGTLMTSSGKAEVLNESNMAVDSILYSSITSKVGKNSIILESGVGMEFVLFRRISLSLDIYYQSALEKIMQVDILYQTANSPWTKAAVWSRGESVNIMLGIKYPIPVSKSSPGNDSGIKARVSVVPEQ